ncbi:tRNA (adenosine(37)-N6)-threonylcarbamoyltransferase complex dimerization subunit type 1 TsaB [[Limnothrix rosea] IAM M-220]|uniref:tRNA (adenosine(37)-N6)-threonylcarbamoyltransferase complex dimerization subunit type 1 TsaB n=1 Tax=[Limnothrix rosea] IAM M-220 TaxID=454133 RepID=UPI00096225E4|nr:tRNA (adenosine(37)-N6)-threonylcarbamoyltransferase complex dimerization subunit type 1 TsaB [[Limnothrix rosea] IAM M-220]OKH17086.1 tRNA (adenosine(37)-N6)-threonylcarbamoyltransferase complex dimerization subunit type 1 TsaB [[Limnothrix rosea] IAM M-220]
MVTANSSQLGLAFHTTTPQLGFASLNLETGDRHSQVWDLGRALSSELHSYLQNFMADHSWESLKFLAVAKGPGGFTSTRIGVVVARTLAQQLNLPLYGISTLAAIAWHLCSTETNQKVAISLPARRGEVFGAIYRITSEGVTTVVEDQLFLPETFEKLALEEKAMVGRSPDDLGITVVDVLDLAYLQWQQNPDSPWGKVTPFYGQHPVHKTKAR